MDGSTLSLGDNKGAVHENSRSLDYVPSLQILYHGDLSRIGEMTCRDTFAKGRWVALGRLDPAFESPHAPERRALEDPYISRAQAALRWNKAQSCFDIKPSEAASLPVTHVALRRGKRGPKRRVLTEATSLPPGSLLDIGGRILLLLQHRLWRGPEEDRLGMVGETPALWGLRQIIKDVAGFERSALILGETGVGKELVCRALHNQSARSEGPFVATNCAALPEQLIESLLFGHKKGAFTGATADREGLFVAASGGVLFLDELGEMPLGLQAKLLRVLEESMVVPVGAKHGIPIDVRVIAATNREPEEAIGQGILRSDLYYRLASHIIKAPTLYKHFHDVPLLFVHFLRLNVEAKPSLSWLWSSPPEAHLPIPMDFFIDLLRHPWRGNVRELQNVTDQTALLNLRPGPFTTPETLSAALHRASPASSTEIVAVSKGRDEDELLLRAAQKLGLKRKTIARLLALTAVPKITGDPRSEAFSQALKEHLADALYGLLERDDFNQTHVAEVLGVSRSTLINLMKRFGLPRARDLSQEALLNAHLACGGDLAAMARMLRVSQASLKLRLVQDPPDFPQS